MPLENMLISTIREATVTSLLEVSNKKPVKIKPVKK